MPEPIDLSTLKNKRSPEEEAEQAFDSLSDEEKQRLFEAANNAEPEARQVRTAFLVIINPEGDVQVTAELNVPLQRAHIPNNDEIYSACATVQKDILVQDTSVRTAMTMQQVAMQAQQQFQAQRLAQSLNLPR